MTEICTYWIIRHKPTGHTLPNAHGMMGRGGSHVEPVAADFDRPRLFTAERAAKGFLTTWLKGKVTRHGHTSYEGEYDETLKIEPVPSRKRDEMEIVKVRLVQ